MFDPQSARLLQSAPAIPGVEPEDMPRLLTEIYSELVTSRVRGENGDGRNGASFQRLSAIANAYEMIATLSSDYDERRASAFVAGSAYQILAKSIADVNGAADMILTRDHISGHIAAALLFLIAEQYADAKEAIGAFKVVSENYPLVLQMLSETLVDLVLENFTEIIERAERRSQIKQSDDFDPQFRATLQLYTSILQGIEVMASNILNSRRPQAAADSNLDATGLFQQVLQTSSRQYGLGGSLGSFLSTYPGPAHLAALLINLGEILTNASILSIPPPDGVDETRWGSWLNFRARQKPLLWSNHRKAINDGFHRPGVSSVIVLPTGAGKTTLSEFKIAAMLASGKKVIFLAPTNALVEQLKYDLNASLPRTLFGGVDDSDDDLYLTVNSELPILEVMTPEKCLALLNFNPDTFTDVGLLVFDECHSLSAESGSFRRALDGMLVILNLLNINPEVDFLFLSAMLKEPRLFADWIEAQSGKQSLLVDLVWKPSRQARCVVVYESDELAAAENAASKMQNKLDLEKRKRKKPPAKNVQSGPSKLLRLKPYGLFGLVHNWHPDRPQDIRIRKLSDEPYQLSGQFGSFRTVKTVPTGNEVSRNLAVDAANSGLKTIVFINNASWTHSSAKKTESLLTAEVTYTEHESKLLAAIESEFGRPDSSMLYQLTRAVPHNADLVAPERQLAESLFRRNDGARIIYATTTLSQGMNLPAQVAILSADERTNLDGPVVTQEPIKAHELLNAAGRAGRAGYLANGLVILVPRTMLSFANGQPEAQAKEVLRSIIPEDERCVLIIDPLQKALDMIQHDGSQPADIEYLFHRLGENREADSVDSLFNRSFGRYVVEQQNSSDDFDQKVANFKVAMGQQSAGSSIPDWLTKLSIQSGISPAILLDLHQSVVNDFERLPVEIVTWVEWLLAWLKDHIEAVRYCFGSDMAALKPIVGSVTPENYGAALDILAKGMRAWLRGAPLITVEEEMGGNLTGRGLLCPKAREVATKLAPRTLAFFSSFAVQIVKRVAEDTQGPIKYLAALECLPAAIAKGFDRPEKLVYYNRIKRPYISRVTAHMLFNATYPQLAFNEEYSYQMIVEAMSGL